MIGRKIHQRGIWTAACHRPELESLTWRYKQSLVGPLWEPVEEGIIFSKSMLCAILNHDDHRRTWLPRIELMARIWPALHTLGMRFHEYTVPSEFLHIGMTQVCYLPKNAKFSRDVDLLSFYTTPATFDFDYVKEFQSI